MAFWNRSKGEQSQRKPAQVRTTPWAWKTVDAVYVGWDRSVWLYRKLPTRPWTWVDGEDRLMFGRTLMTLFDSVADTTPKVPVPAMFRNTISLDREFHLVTITWEAPNMDWEQTPPHQTKFLNRTLSGLTFPQRTVFFGVRLKPKLEKKHKENTITEMRALISRLSGEDVPELDFYAGDHKMLNDILSRAGATVPNRLELRQLESWYNLGRGPERLMAEEWEQIVLNDDTAVEMAAAASFRTPKLQAPESVWLLNALNHSASPQIVSVRGLLEPAEQARRRARQSQRWVFDQAKVEEQTEDELGRPELRGMLQLGQELEQHFQQDQAPLLNEVSVIFGRVVEDTTETYADMLSEIYNIDVVPLLGRQMDALNETLPCSPAKANPYPQALTPGMIAYSGGTAWSGLGDEQGVFVGLTAEDAAPVFLDPLGAPKANRPASMAVFGDSGSGKTFFLQLLALQSALSGLPVTLCNPKGYEGGSLAGLVKITKQLGVPARLLKLSQMESAKGFFDPFSYADPEVAADTAAKHIMRVLIEFDQPQRLALEAGLREGAAQGSRCVGDALRFVRDDEVRRQVTTAAEGSSRFALGVGLTPQDSTSAGYGRDGLTLIEFDRPLGLPETTKKQYSHTELIALAAMHHIIASMMEITAGAGGGVLIVDEAWTILSQPEGLALLEGIGREGRSLNILPVLATQKIADVIGRDMEGLLSRVICLELQEKKEASRALQLCGLEPNEVRLSRVASMGPRRLPDGSVRVAQAFHRDLQSRKGVLFVGPTLPEVAAAFETNPAIRAEQHKKAAREAG